MHPCAGDMGEKSQSPQLTSVCLVFKVNRLQTALITHVVMGWVHGAWMVLWLEQLSPWVVLFFGIWLPQGYAWEGCDTLNEHGAKTELCPWRGWVVSGVGGYLPQYPGRIFWKSLAVLLGKASLFSAVLPLETCCASQPTDTCEKAAHVLGKGASEETCCCRV